MNLARSIVAFLLIPLCVLVHFLLATEYEIYEIRPIWAIIIICASLIVLLRLLIRTKVFKKSILRNLKILIFVAENMFFIKKKKRLRQAGGHLQKF